MALDIKKSIVLYLEDQRDIEIDALKSYEEKDSPMDSAPDPEIKMFREKEAQKIKDRLFELKKHIAVIKRM
ncbi:MAG: hypothetical protein IT271_12460 [Chitinophagales bacterium]|nr:hypothetical protein [Chitinophagales bacterium]